MHTTDDLYLDARDLTPSKAGVNVAGFVVTLLLGEETRGRALSDTSAASPEPTAVSSRVLADDLPR